MEKNGTASLSMQLAKMLREAIYSGEYLPGDLLPSERKLSETNELSRTTVRRAIDILADEGILHRKAGSGTYVGDFNTVQSLNSTLGLIVPTLANPFYGEFLNVIENHANENGFQILIGQSDYTGTKETAYLMRYAEEFAVKGVIVVPNLGEITTGAYDYLNLKHKPFVFAGRWPQGIDADAICSDYEYGASEIISYLIELGHSQIAYIEGNPHFHNSPLLAGYRQALKAANISESTERILLLDESAEKAGANGIRHLIDNGIEFTAVFARNDYTASGVIQALIDTGLHVPRDVSVVGFDSTKLAEHLRPTLTTVDTTLHEIGRQSVKMLLDRVTNIYDGPPRRIMVQPRLIIRESSAPPQQSENVG